MENEKRALTDVELLEWAQNLGDTDGLDGLDAEAIYRMMRDTAGSAYDAGEADYEFDLNDAERMLKLARQ